MAPGEPTPGKPMKDKRILDFTEAHDDVAVPILADEIKTRIASRGSQRDRHLEWTIFVFLDWATYSASPRGIDAVGDLCAASEKDCKFFVNQLLVSAVGREGTYGVAHDLVERHPEVRDLAVAWCEKSLQNRGAENLFASQMMERVDEGHAIKDDDAILSHLAPATGGKVMGAFEELSRERQPHRN
jgi:hypothetical protein